MQSVKKQLEQPKSFKEQPLNKSMGILDDFSVRKSSMTREAEIQDLNKSLADLRVWCNLLIQKATSGRILFAGTNKEIKDDSALFWDNTNKRLGIGTETPSADVEIRKSSNPSLTLSSVASSGILSLKMQWNGTTYGGMSTNLTNGEVRFGGLQAAWFPTFYSGNSERMRITAAGNIGLGLTNPSKQLDLTGSINLTNTSNSNQNGIIYKEGVRFIHNFAYGDNGTAVIAGENTFLGIEAGNLTMGSTGTIYFHSSYNTGFGYRALANNVKGYNNSAFGHYAFYSNTDGANNLAIGSNAMRNLTTGSNNFAMGHNAGRYIADGTTAMTNCGTSTYLGINTKAAADGRSNETVIGFGATGNGNNSVVLGNTSVTSFQVGTALGINATITTAPLTSGGASGSMTFVNGILTAQTQST